MGLDCILVGYHEPHQRADELDAVADLDEGPPPISNLLRTRLRVDGHSLAYLDAVSYLRRGDEYGNYGVYNVAELPNLGAIYLANFLRRRGHHAEVVNSFTYERSRLAELLEEGPASVAVTTTFYMSPAPVVEIVRTIREHRPEIPVIVGGPLVDNCCRDMSPDQLGRVFDRMGADVYVRDSQGEATLAALIDGLCSRRTLGGIPNTFTHDGTGWRFTTRRPENNDIDAGAVSWSDFDCADIGPTVSTRTARSCAFKCAFCDYPARAGALALADLDTVARELEELAEMGVQRVAFIDDTFNVPVRRFQALCRMMVERQFGIEWFSYFRCGNARDSAIYDLMYEAGCRGVLLGIESGDDAVLKAMDKRATTSDYRFGIEQLEQRDIFVHASLVVGFPGETAASVQRTIEFINQTHPDTFAVNHWYYVSSTPIQSRADTVGLSGSGYQWSHATMSSGEAVAQANRVFFEVTEAAWMPVNGLDFWGVPYLLGKGLEPSGVVELLERAKPLTLASRLCTGSPQAQERHERAFADLCATLPLEPARYQVTYSEHR